MPREIMPLTTGARIGPYEIKSPLGEGGMGVVYRANDTKLRRDVAIKLLPDHFAGHPDRLSWFQREAQVLAALNHPNIAQIYGLEESDDRRCIVMELVEGETLADIIRRGPIPMKDALRYAKQIAEAVETAHDRGIIHRDLKPANIKVTPDGMIKVLDFGIAKAYELQPDAVDMSDRPTLEPSISGVILGTAAYMSSERVKGREADRSSDVWAFACVLYEMLTGRRLFGGQSVTEILAEVLKVEPQWDRLPAETPKAIRRLLRQALQKEEKLRRRDFRDVRIEIDEVLSGAPDAVQALPTKRKRALPRLAAWVFAGSLALALAVWVGGRMVQVPWAPEVRFEISTPPSTDNVSIAVSPDGKQILFVAEWQAQDRLWLRSLDSATARPLPGTENGMFPFWAPDNRSVGFFADYRLKRIDTVTGVVQTLASAPAGRGGAWSIDGRTIVFAPAGADPISRVSADGGEPVAITKLKPGQQYSHRFPHILADGKHFTFFAQGSAEGQGLYAESIDGSGEPVRLMDDYGQGYGAATISPGFLVFRRQGALFAQNLDLGKLALNGPQLPVAAPASTEPIVVVVGAEPGVIAYRARSRAAGHYLWFNRSGEKIEEVGQPNLGIDPSLSPDGRFLAVRTQAGNNDIGILDMKRNVLERFTFDPGIEAFPVWSPDGSRIAFSSSRTGAYKLYWKSTKSTTGSESEQPLLDVHGSPMDWSLDGRLLLYQNPSARGDADLWVLPLDKERKPYPVAQTEYQEQLGQFSPEAKWMAWQSDESGRDEIYLQPLPGSKTTGGKRRISTNGGQQVRWRRDGKELFYVAPDNKLMAVPIQFSPGETSVEAGNPSVLFPVRLTGRTQTSFGYQYVASADGQRFLMYVPSEEPDPPINVIMNWKPKP
jgi:serine/threonine protein kinase/Tol biopolymer transport system component